MNIRAVAAGVLQQVLQDKRSLTTVLDATLPNIADLQARSVIQAMSYGVLRHYLLLMQLFNTLLDKPLKAKDLPVTLLALIGLYQLKFMRVKTHAAVAETVNALKPPHIWAKGLLNAILRRYIRERETLETVTLTDHSIRYSHPAWLLNALATDWPRQLEAILHANNQAPPMTLRVNLTRCTRATYANLLATAGIASEPVAFSPAGLVLSQPVSVSSLPHFAQGWVSVQDAAAQLAASLLQVQPGQRVLDLCAAPGGKTCALLENQPALAELWAVDSDGARLARVQANLTRLKLSAHCVQGDALHPDNWWDGRLFDRILVDVPCSALGVIRRHPDIKYLRSPEDVIALSTLQQAILMQAWQLLAPGGMLLYATCSVLKQENELQLTAFLAQHPEAHVYPIEADWGFPVTVGQQLLPGIDVVGNALPLAQSLDGFYYARLYKPAT